MRFSLTRASAAVGYQAIVAWEAFRSSSPVTLGAAPGRGLSYGAA